MPSPACPPLLRVRSPFLIGLCLWSLSHQLFLRVKFCLPWLWQHQKTRSGIGRCSPSTALLTCQEPPGPEPATRGGALLPAASQAFSWKLPRGCQCRKSLNLLLSHPDCHTYPPAPTRHNLRVEDEIAPVLLTAPLQSHHYVMELKGCADLLGLFSGTSDKVTGMSLQDQPFWTAPWESHIPHTASLLVQKVI